MTDDPTHEGDMPDDELTPEEQAEFDEWSRRFNELEAEAEAAEASADPRRIAETTFALAEHLAGVVELDDLVGLLLDAREAYAQFDALRAAQCASEIAMCALRAGDLTQSADAFDIAIDEFGELGEWTMWATCLAQFGGVLGQLGEFDLAETAIMTAINDGPDCGLDDGTIREARLLLANVMRMTGRFEEAEREMCALLTEHPADSADAAECAESLGALYAETGRPALAQPEFERAVAIYVRLGDEQRELEVQSNQAWVLISLGYADAGMAMMRSVRERFVAAGRSERVAAIDYNLASAYVYRGRFDDADEAFAAAAKGLAEAGMHHQLANLQWNRVKRLTTEAAMFPARTEALKPDIVNTALSALIAADYERYQFDDAPRRAKWMEHLGHRMTWTFLIVYKFGSPQLMADLIESALSGGVYALSAEGADDVVGFDDGPPPRSAATPEDVDDRLALALGAAALLSTPVLPLAPPPALVDGTGRELMGPARAIAAGLDPDLAEVLAKVPRVSVW